MPKQAQYLQTAMALHQAGRMQEAENAYRKLLKVNAHHADGLRLLGTLYLQTGQIGSAAEALGKAAQFLPKDAETLTNLSIALRGLNRTGEAAAHLKRALSVQSDYLPALLNLSDLLYETGNGAEAADLFWQIAQQCPDSAPAHFNHGNCLLSSDRIDEAISCYERALQLKTDYLEAMINLGIALGLKGKSDQSRWRLHDAKEWLEKALTENPLNAAALNNMGSVLRQLGETGRAVASFQKALSLRPDYLEARLNLATGLRDLGQLDDAIENCRTALQLNPNSANAYINLGAFLQEKARHAEAVAAFAEALQLKPSSIDAQWNKALSHLALGQYKEGWGLHEVGLGTPHMRGNYDQNRRWNGEELAGSRLLIRCEQGLGDNLQFVRYAELCKARGATVLVSGPDLLHPLLANCPFIDAIVQNVAEDDFDLHVPIMSLPFIFGTEIDTIPTRFPYLHISDKARAQWAGKFGDKRGFKVGLVWAGNPREDQINAHLIDQRRSMDLEMLRPLFVVEGAHFYSLQAGPKASQIKTCDLCDHLTDLMESVQNFEDTGAIVERLDLVISVDTSVVHLAGGMGKPVWIMSRYDACWRWLQNRPDSPWYPSARVFGQQKPGDWAGVVAEIKKDLAAAIQG